MYIIICRNACRVNYEKFLDSIFSSLTFYKILRDLLQQKTLRVNLIYEGKTQSKLSGNKNRKSNLYLL